MTGCLLSTRRFDCFQKVYNRLCSGECRALLSAAMRKQYTLEILALALLMATGSVLKPMAAAPGCTAQSATKSLANTVPVKGGRG